MYREGIYSNINDDNINSEVILIHNKKYLYTFHLCLSYTYESVEIKIVINIKIT